MQEKETKLYDTAEAVQTFILVAVESDQPELTADQSLDELADLLRTAGGEEAGRLIQRREAPHPGTYLGSGKIEELKRALEMTGAAGAITDDELTPAQLRNLSEALGAKVIDRTLLILDIFSQRATTRARIVRYAAVFIMMLALGKGIGAGLFFWKGW